MNDLSKVLGRENFSTSRIDRIIYGVDASRIEGKASAVALPGSTEQVRRIVSYAKRLNANIVPRGAGTGLAGGAVPKDSIVVDLSRMNRILKLDIRRKVVIAEPGVVLENLNLFLKKYALFFPVLPSSRAACTIGGMASTNAAGNNAVRYGRMSDWVDELEIIDGTGKQFVLRGKEAEEFCGTEGTAGIITRIALKLAEPPDKKSFMLYRFSTINELLDALRGLKELSITQVEFLDRLTSAFVGIEPAYHLFVEFDDDSGEIKDDVKINELEALRESAYPLLASRGYSFIEDPQVGPEGIGELLVWLEKNSVPSFGHLATGIIHPCFSNEDLIPGMYDVVRKLNGKISGEHGIGLKKKEYAEKSVVEKIKKLKKAYDPHRIMNKGKVI